MYMKRENSFGVLSFFMLIMIEDLSKSVFLQSIVQP